MAFADSNSFTITPTGAPSWFVAMPLRTWTQVAMGPSGPQLFQRGARFDSQYPSFTSGNGPAYVIRAWTGSSVDQVRGEYLLVGNGGHANYAGNEGYGCDIRSEQPRWMRYSDPSTNITIDDGTGRYPDGKFRSVHGWHSCTFANGKVFYPLQAGVWNTGFAYPWIWTWDRNSLGNGPFPVSAAANPWTRLGQGITGSGFNMEAGCGAFDKSTGRVWGSVGSGANGNGQSFWHIDSVSNVITPVNCALQGGRPRWGSIAHDLGIWVLGCMHEGKLEILNVASPGSSTTVRIPTGTPNGMIDGAGSVYHQSSRALIVWDHRFGANLRKLKIPANPFTGTYTWSDITPAAGGVTPPGSVPSDFNNVYSKFNIIEDMGNGESAFVAICSDTGGVFVFRPGPGELF